MTSDVRDPTAPLTPAVGADAHSLAWKERCLNCGAALTGPFCAECGQRALPPHPTVGELAGDAFAEFSGWDGKFVTTLRLLLARPGALTRQWLDGRRAQFISPLRLYLATSLVYFVIAAAAPNPRVDGNGRLDIGGVQIGLSGSKREEDVSVAASRAVASRQALAGAERDSALASIGAAPRLLRPMFRRAIEDPAGFRTAIMQAMPRVMFGLVPVLAALFALFFRRRHYPEHLYFAIHLMSFCFIARGLGNLTLFSGSLVLASVAQVAMIAWIAAYAFVAIRRVYGGSALATIAKGFAISLLYGIVATVAIAGMALAVTA